MQRPVSSSQEINIAYLVSEYPAYSHTFILREVDALRRLGAKIHTASINVPKIPQDKLGNEESREQKNTFYIKKQGPIKAIGYFLKSLFTHPVKLIKGMSYASRLAGWDLKKQVYHLFYLFEALILGEWMQKNRLGHLHVHFANPASTVALLLNKLFSIPFSITVHGPDEFYDVTLNLLSEKVGKASFVCCISDYSRSQLMRISSPKNWRKLEKAPLGIKPAEFPPRPLPVENLSFQILCVARLAPSKGQQILISAVQKLILKGYNIHLKLIGEGANRPFLEKQIRALNLQSRVELLGALALKEVLEEYQRTDLFVLSSFAEGVPVVLMEAMSMEIPCIAPRIHGIPELIRDGIDGILFSPSNVDDLAQAISLLIDQPDIMDRLGKAGRKKIQEKYDLERNVEYLYKIFKTHFTQKA